MEHAQEITDLHLIGQIEWIAPEDGGRAEPPTGSRYGATFEHVDVPGKQFSILVVFDAQDRRVVSASFVNPQFVVEELGLEFSSGESLRILEGSRPVALLRITDVIRPRTLPESP